MAQRLAWARGDQLHPEAPSAKFLWKSSAIKWAVQTTAVSWSSVQFTTAWLTACWEIFCLYLSSFFPQVELPGNGSSANLPPVKPVAPTNYSEVVLSGDGPATANQPKAQKPGGGMTYIQVCYCCCCFCWFIWICNLSSTRTLGTSVMRSKCPGREGEGDRREERIENVLSTVRRTWRQKIGVDSINGNSVKFLTTSFLQRRQAHRKLLNNLYLFQLQQ